MKLRLLAVFALISFGTSASANEWIVTEASTSKGGNAFTVGFAGDGSVMDAMIDLNYDSATFVAKVSALNGASCTIHPDGGTIRVITPIMDSSLDKSIAVLCQISFSGLSGKAASAPSLSVASSECSRGAGKDASCDVSSASLSK